MVVANLILGSAFGVLGAAIAVAVAPVFWLVTVAIATARLGGLRTDAVYLLGPVSSARQAPG